MPLEATKFPAHSELIAPALEEQLKQLLQKVTEPIEFVCLVGADAKSIEMAALLNHLCGLRWMRRWMHPCCPPPVWAGRVRYHAWCFTEFREEKRSPPLLPPF